MVDFVIPMNYTPEVITFMNNIEIIKNNIDKDCIKKIIMGISVYNQTAESAVDKIFLTRLNQFNGISLFSYGVHKDSLEWFAPVIKSMQEP